MGVCPSSAPSLGSHLESRGRGGGGGCHSLVMPSARMSDILQQDDKMRMLGWSMMSTCPDGRRDGRWADKWARGAEAAPEVGLGGEQDCPLQELDGRTQDPTPTHQTHPDPSGSLGVPHIQGTPHLFAQTFLPHSYLPFAILFDAPNDSTQNFCRGGWA